jgi:predicted RNase H-like nuclease (RuvC/YqgF family)
MEPSVRWPRQLFKLSSQEKKFLNSSNRYKAEGASMDKRSEYVEKLSSQIVEWDVQIDRLRDRAENASDGEEFEYWLAGAILQHKRDRAAEILRSMAATRNTDWEKLKSEAEDIRRNLRNFLSSVVME